MVMFIESTKQCDDDEFAQRHFYLKDTKKPSLFKFGIHRSRDWLFVPLPLIRIHHEYVLDLINSKGV